MRRADPRPTALVAEDEPLLREELVECLRRLWPDLDIVGQAADGVEALRMLGERAPSVLFLDIEMPGVNGLEVARHAAGRAHCVFVTAYDQHAVAAFEQGAVDYLLKPLAPARVALAVDRVRARLGTVPADLSALANALAAERARSRPFLRWINASVGTSIKVITVEEVCYFRADHRYTLVATPGADSLIRKTLRELVDELDPRLFMQVHRSTLVNLGAIAGVTRDIRGHLQLTLKQRREALPVAEQYAHLFRQM